MKYFYYTYISKSGNGRGITETTFLSFPLTQISMELENEMGTSMITFFAEISEAEFNEFKKDIKID